jgi:hypothetical protein
VKKVRRDEILPLPELDAWRERARPSVLEAKRLRRVHAGPLTFLCENAETVRWQIHEMIRAERLFREEEVAHELETYNELLGGPGELGCALLIEIPDPAERDRRLREWLELPRHLYAELPDGRKVRPTFDARQVATDRLSSVQYLRFEVGAEAPVALGADLPALAVRGELTAEQRRAIAADLASDAP